MSPLTIDRLRALFFYDDTSGDLIRLVKTSNRVAVGDVAGSIGARGYLRTWIDGRHYYNHVLVWAHVTGQFPNGDLDHGDTNSLNNRFGNLREATDSQNQSNQGPDKSNTSGHKGVSWNKRLSKWHAYISFDNKRHHLGFFSDFEDAASNYRIAALQYHGEFSRF